MDIVAHTPITLLDSLDEAAGRFWPKANKKVIWGWKRDIGEQNRLVYFSGEIGLLDGAVCLERFYFHFAAKLEADGSDQFLADLRAAEERFAQLRIPATLDIGQKGALLRPVFSFGVPNDSDLDRCRRLKLRRPRRSIVVPDLPEPKCRVELDDLLPADLYVGSGMSYEAGLPTLCDVHEFFGVDSEDMEGFMVGSDDWLPRALSEEGIDRLEKFCRVHTMALTAQVTPAMKIIRGLVDTGKIRRVFTDNVDNVLSKAGVDFERVRGSGVFNEKYKTDFSSPNLIVVGVAADRRQIVRQARAAGLKVTVVNPCKKVSPNVTHLDYVRSSDLFYKQTAHDFFARLDVAHQ